MSSLALTPARGGDASPMHDHAFVAKMRCVRCRQPCSPVPGTVFTDNFVFRWQAYVRDVPDGSPSEWPDPPKFTVRLPRSGVPATVCMSATQRVGPV